MSAHDGSEVRTSLVGRDYARVATAAHKRAWQASAIVTVP